ncbi:serine hydrolase [Undibacterium sp. TJN25]|uniref:serine hydrolase n=1 Tax=Undibacterium sp. TJN25 TaxID=3413056 RepID=UPI003BF17D6C
MLMKNLIATGLVLSCLAGVTHAAQPRIGSSHALVIEDGTGKILLEKNSNDVVPIASLTKLMTAMVVLDARPDMEAPIQIEQEDVDMLKHSMSRVPVGATMPRKDVLQLALMSSDNRAAASLARTYPGGRPAFMVAVQAKIKGLGLSNTVIEEPTGLSPSNRSNAVDLAKMAEAASKYPDIVRITTDSGETLNINGRQVEYHNSNRLVGKKGWDIGLSKTGFTNEAGNCLIMRIKAAGRNATLVLLNAKASSARLFDASSIRRLLTGEPEPQPVTRVFRHHRHKGH